MEGIIMITVPPIRQPLLDPIPVFVAVVVVVLMVRLVATLHPSASIVIIEGHLLG